MFREHDGVEEARKDQAANRNIATCKDGKDHEGCGDRSEDTAAILPRPILCEHLMTRAGGRQSAPSQ